MKKRILSFLLTLCLTMAFLPTNVLAASTAKYELCWPLLTTTSGYKTITSSLGNRTAPIEGATVSHKGIDIGVKTSSAVLSAADGIVYFVGYNNARGNYVVIYHESLALTSVYQHLSSYAVTEGQTVNKGQEIARSGSTGIVTGPHLHFELVVTSSAPVSVNCAWTSNAQLLDGHYNNSLKVILLNHNGGCI